MIIQQEKDIEYYSVGNKEHKILSNSFFSALNPEQGGSPQKALAFFERKVEEIESRSLSNGKVVHKYSEAPAEFGIASIPRPSETLGELSDEFYRLSSSGVDLSSIPIDIVSTLKSDKGKSANVLEIKEAFEKLQARLEIPTLEATIRIFRTARANVNAYKTYGEAVVIDSMLNKCIDYIKQLDKLKDKVLLSLSDKEKIENVIVSLRKNKVANRLLGLSGDFDTNLVLKEWDIYFSLANIYPAKARIDNIYIDFDAKIIYLIDLKTTSKPLALFKETLEFYRYYRQLAFYRLAVKTAIEENMLGVPKSIYFDLAQVAEFPIQPLIIAVETTDNYESCVFDLYGYMQKGTEELKSLALRFDYHNTLNNWESSMEQLQGNGIVTLIPD